MIRAMVLWIAVPLLMTPMAVAVDDPALQELTVEELWTKWNNGNEAAYERLVERGSEARVLAHRILFTEGAGFPKWPGSGDVDLLKAMRADAVPELLKAMDRTSGTEDRIHFMNHFASLGRMA